MANPLKIRALRKISKFFSVVGIFALIFNIFFTNSLVRQNISEAKAQTGDMCQAPVDVVLVLDVSGSMAEGGSQSKCEWEELKWVGGAGGSFQWDNVFELDISPEVCAAKCDELGADFCRTPVYTPDTPNKIELAKTAAKNFLTDMGPSDQSALVSFSDSASLIQQLSSDHTGTKSAVDGLTTNGATNIGGAIEFASGELGSARANPQAVKAMILLTDGKANKPNGDGMNENSTDVVYAETKAAEAAALGYKIFTIGLGANGEINEAMLQGIASLTQAQYYHANNGDDLSGIYSLIAEEVCQYGSISGYKYNDINHNGIIDEGEPKLAGWEITLGGSATSTQSTDENGYYIFSGLSASSYAVAEGANAGKQPFTQVWPVGNLYQQVLTEGQNAPNLDFANYLPVCGNNILDSGEICDDGNLINGDGCSSTCQTESGPATNNNVIFGYKYRDHDGLASTTNDRIGLNGWFINLFTEANTSTPIFSTTTNSLGYFEFNSLTAGNYLLTENDVSGWTQLAAPSLINLIGTSTVSENNNFVNATSTSTSTEPVFLCGNGLDDDADGLIDSLDPGCHSDNNPNNPSSHDPNKNNETDSPICGNTIKEGNETCDDGNLINGDGCSFTCQTETSGGTGGGGGGGGSIIPLGLSIFNEVSINVSGDSATLTWQTNYFSTSRVIYSAESEPHDFAYGNLPNYGYAHSTIDDLTQVTFHTMYLTGLTPDTLYYYRVISHASPDTVGTSFTFRTLPLAVGNQISGEPGASGAPSRGVEGNISGGVIGGSSAGAVATAENSAGSVVEGSTGGAADESGRVLGAEDQGGRVAGALEICKKWPHFLWIILLAYLLMLIINYADKIKKDSREKYGSYLNWLFVLLPPAVAIASMFLCVIWAWWLWILMILLYLVLIVFYFVDDDSPVYWRVSALAALFMAIIAWIVR